MFVCIVDYKDVGVLWKYNENFHIFWDVLLYEALIQIRSLTYRR